MGEREADKYQLVFDIETSDAVRFRALSLKLGKSDADTFREGAMLVEFFTDYPDSEQQFLRIEESLRENAPDLSQISKSRSRFIFDLADGAGKRILAIQAKRDFKDPKDLFLLALRYREDIAIAQDQGIPINIDFNGKVVDLVKHFENRGKPFWKRIF